MRIEDDTTTVLFSDQSTRDKMRVLHLFYVKVNVVLETRKPPPDYSKVFEDKLGTMRVQILSCVET